MIKKNVLKNATIGMMLGSLLFSSGLVSANEGTEYRPTDYDKVSNFSKSSVDALYKEGLIVGYSDGTFQPKKDITRAEFVAMLIRVMKYTEENENLKFSDSTKGENWHYNTMNVAYNNGLLFGEGKDKDGNIIMNPNKKITRLEMMVILNRVYEQLGETMIIVNEEEADLYLEFYEDAEEVPEWAKETVVESLLLGITGGVSDTKLGINQKGNREQSAVFSHRAKLKKDQLKKDEILKEEMNQFMGQHPDIFTFYDFFGPDYQSFINDEYYSLFTETDYNALSTFVKTNLSNNELVREVKANNYKIEAEFLTQLAPYGVDLEKYPEVEGFKFMETFFRSSQYQKIQDAIPDIKIALLKDGAFSKRYNAALNNEFNKGGVEGQAQFEDKFNKLLAFDVLAEILWNTNVNIAELEKADIAKLSFVD